MPAKVPVRVRATVTAGTGLQLFESAAALVAIILAVGPVSGGHLNPVVTLMGRFLGALPWREAGTSSPRRPASPIRR